jgi:hypothetical protein
LQTSASIVPKITAGEEFPFDVELKIREAFDAAVQEMLENLAFEHDLIK